MRRLGVVVRTAGGVALVRTDTPEPPSIGTPVIDDQLERVGRVVDVIGPVDAPYAVVSPDERPPAAVFDQPLYVR